MLDAIGKFPNDARLQTAYASMLIGHKEFDEAALRITRLEGKPELPALSMNFGFDSLRFAATRMKFATCSRR